MFNKQQVLQEGLFGLLAFFIAFQIMFLVFGVAEANETNDRFCMSEGFKYGVLGSNSVYYMRCVSDKNEKYFNKDEFDLYIGIKEIRSG